jgi:hypothetical protein
MDSWELMTSPHIVGIDCRVRGDVLWVGILIVNTQNPPPWEVALYPDGDGAAQPIRVRLPELTAPATYRQRLEICHDADPIPDPKAGR